MWFKQVQLFQLTESIRLPLAQFIEKLDALAFTSCMPSMPSSAGWIAPADEDGAPLAQMMNNNFIFCLQIEEKILPAAVVRQELADRIKQIQTIENRKIYQNEKMALKDDIIATLLLRIH